MIVPGRGAAMLRSLMRRALRLILWPLLLYRWIRDPGWSFRHGRDAIARPAGRRHRYLPEGRRPGDGSVLRRRKLILIAVVWSLAAMLLLSVIAYRVATVGEVEHVGQPLAAAAALLMLTLGISAALKLRPARRSRHLELAPERGQARMDDPLEVRITLSDRVSGQANVEAGLVCRRQWTAWENWRVSVCIIRDRKLWEAWTPVPYSAGAIRHVSLVAPAAERPSSEGDEASVYWFVGARAARRLWPDRRSEVPIWIEE